MGTFKIVVIGTMTGTLLAKLLLFTFEKIIKSIRHKKKIKNCK